MTNTATTDSLDYDARMADARYDAAHGLCVAHCEVCEACDHGDDATPDAIRNMRSVEVTAFHSRCGRFASDEGTMLCDDCAPRCGCDDCA